MKLHSQITEDAPYIHVTEMRRAFYAGVAAMVAINYTVGDEAMIDTVGEEILSGIDDEIRMFVDDIKKGVS